MKRLVISFLVIFFVSFNGVALAAGGESQSGSVNLPQGNQVQNQNQIQTQNQATESKLQVAHQEMEALAEMKALTGEVGSQIQTQAQEQIQVQEQVQTQLKKLQSRQGLVKKIFGPHYGAIKNLEGLMEQNQLRVEELTQLKTQVYNWSATNQIQSAIQALVEQNTALEEQIQMEKETKSLLGWVFRLFY